MAVSSVLIVAACAETDRDPGGGAAAAGSTITDTGAQDSGRPMTPQAVAERLQCTGYAEVVTDEEHVRQASTCSLDGELVRIFTVADVRAINGLVDRTARAGGVSVHGNQWLVSVRSADAAQLVQRRLGGTIA